MRLSRPSRLAAAVVVTLSLLPLSATAAGATPGEGATDRRSGAVTAEGRTAASQALATVRRLFTTGAPSAQRGAAGADAVAADPTVALRDLALRVDELTPADRRVARTYLARPTNGSDPLVSYARRARVTNDCVRHRTKGSHVCVHYARKTADKPSLRDRDGNGLPDQVDRTRDTANRVWKKIVNHGGYKRPPKDRKGPNRKFDIYLADIGKLGYYGYCVPERQVSGRAYSGYCVLDDDYSRREFPTNSPKGNLHVTVAHEFFHAVQFAYDAGEDGWFMEGTATWMEDELYTKVNDNRNYLRYSALADPGRSLDYDGNSLYVYGNWLWWRYVSERVSAKNGTGLPVVMRHLWEKADASSGRSPDQYSMQAAETVLGPVGTLGGLFAGFGVANRRPADLYREGSNYTPAPLTKDVTLTAANASRNGSLTLAHMANGTVALRPADDLGSRTLRLHLDGPSPSQNPVATVTTVFVDDTATDQRVPLDVNGVGDLVVTGFGSGTVRRVEITFTNAGHAYSCRTGTTWSCQGTPKSDGRVFTYRATATTG